MTTTVPPTAGTGAAVPPRPDRRPWRPLVTAVTFALGALVAVSAGEVARSGADVGQLLGGAPVSPDAGAAAQAAASGWVALWVVTLGIAAALLSWGWAILQNLPSRQGTTIVLILGSLLCYVPAARVGWGVTWLPAALAVSVICEFVHQLARRDGRPRLVESVSSVVAGLAILACGALLMPGAGPAAPVATIAGGIAGAALADPLATRHGGRIGGVLAGLLGALGGALVAAWLGLGWIPLGALLAAIAGLTSLALRRVHSAAPYLFGRRAQAAGAAASVLIVGALASVFARALG